MRSTPLLLEATPLEGYLVRVCFEDGTAGQVDIGYLLDYGGVFEPLRDPGFFCQLRCGSEAGTIVWPNDADIAPETLYAKACERAAASAWADPSPRVDYDPDHTAPRSRREVSSSS